MTMTPSLSNYLTPVVDIGAIEQPIPDRDGLLRMPRGSFENILHASPVARSSSTARRITLSHTGLNRHERNLPHPREACAEPGKVIPAG